ncbi:MAG: GNAT family N-acetyltransferase [Candidatus Methanoplasma sp.]|jgi:ribosomal protein S18 acetylase RimI-like enzyme|nr:GNAT family N-acetyltransferase [Candidatus Methanoplasma sp.]
MRFCDTDEAKELARMAREIWMDYFPSIVGKDATEYIMNLTQSEEAIRQQILDGSLYYFITECSEKAGYICIRPEGDSLFISKVYVSKKFRGKGLGSKALNEVLEKGKAMKMKKAYLRVNKNNALAIGIYMHKGFVTVREEKLDIGNGFFMDDCVMEYRF